MSKHVMVDLETLGTRPHDCILSIGAVEFDLVDGIGREFYTTIDPVASKNLGFKATVSTLEWWSKQSVEAREAAFKGEKHPEEALRMFTAWLPSDVVLWGNGSDFDNVLLSAAYDRLGFPTPWKFWNNRCYRTMKNLLKGPPLERVGDHHNALDDAKSQANHLIALMHVANLELK